MDNLHVVDIIQCHICSGTLLPHPLYGKSGAKYCPTDGDFFIQKLRGETPTVIFRALKKKRQVKKRRSKKPAPFKIFLPKIQAHRLVVKAPIIPPIPQPLCVAPLTFNFRLRRRGGHPGIVIRCDQTGVVYDSLKEAAEAMSLSRNYLSLHVTGKARHVKGYTFTVLDESEKPPPFAKKRRLRSGGGVPSKRLRCEQTGQVFETLREAAEEMGFGRKYLSRHINDRVKYPSVRGYSFEVWHKEI